MNDNLAPDVMRTLLLAEEVYDDAKYRQAAGKLADFLLAAQCQIRSRRGLSNTTVVCSYLGSQVRTTGNYRRRIAGSD